MCSGWAVSADTQLIQQQNNVFCFWKSSRHWRHQFSITDKLFASRAEKTWHFPPFWGIEQNVILPWISEKIMGVVWDESLKERDRSAFCFPYTFCRKRDHLLLALQNPDRVSDTAQFGWLGRWCCFLPCFIIDAKQTLLCAAPEPLRRGYSCYLYSLNSTYCKIALSLITERFLYSDQHWTSLLKVK